MVIRRTNLNVVSAQRADLASSTAEACYRAMQRHAEGAPPPGAARTVSSLPPPSAPPSAKPPAGDIIYGAKAIARHIFGDDGNRARRRVFSLWNHYRDRNQRAGFFKLKGALCLSITQWKAFHGLD
jgi:hypothetical protein